jgi:hypothetical protein
VSKGLELIFILVSATLILIGVVLFDMHYPTIKYYDCSLAEISPDFPIEVKQECRKIKQNTV